jgi:hypothetical protein
MPPPNAVTKDRETPSDSDLRGAIMDLVQERGPDKTICPSEAARRVSSSWRPLMGRIRRVAMVLAKEGRVRIEKGGEPIEPDALVGPVRLRLRER